MIIKRINWETLVAKAAAYDELHRRLVAALKQNEETKLENNALKTRCDREQQRADNAMQTMVASKTGIAIPAAPVAPSAEEIDPHSEDPGLVEELQKDIKKRGPMAVLAQHGMGSE